MTEPDSDGVPLGSSVKKGIAWSTLTFGLSRVLAFGSALALTRLLLPSEFGVAAAVLVVTGVIEMCADLGMQATVIYEQEADAGERVQTAFTVNLMVAGLLTGVLVLLAPAIARYFHVAHHTGLFRLAALDVLLTGLGSIHDGLLLRDLRFRTRIATEVVAATARAGVGVGLALAGFGPASLVWGLLAGTVAWLAALWSLSRFRPRLRFDPSIARSMVRYGLGAASLEIMAVIITRLDSTVVGGVLGPQALGLYTVGFRLPDLVLESIAVQVSLVAFPALARKRMIDAGGLAAATHRLVRYLALYALPLAAGMAVLAPSIVVLVFSRRWQGAAGVVAAVSVMSALSASVFALGDAFKALGRQGVMVKLNLVALPLLIVTVVIAADYGITAVAWARALCAALWVAMMTVAASRVLGISARGTLAALRPGAAAAVGVALGAGAVRLSLGLPPVGELLLGGAAGAAGGAGALALLDPASFAELRRALSRRGGSARPV